MHFSLIAPDTLPVLSAAVEVAAFRIIQEAVANVIQHANATNCHIRIEIEDTKICLTVDDDGHGMYSNSHTGIGLLTMRERAEELGGTFQITANEYGGTQVKVQLPLPLPEAIL